MNAPEKQICLIKMSKSGNQTRHKISANIGSDDSQFSKGRIVSGGACVEREVLLQEFCHPLLCRLASKSPR